MAERPPAADDTVAKLAALFLEHPAWRSAARRIARGSTSRVFFSHRAGEPWHLLRSGDQSLLRPGPTPDPDFAFRFTPASVERLAAVEGGVGEFAVELFSLITEADEDLHIGFRVVAPFSRLARRGYLRLLLDAGPKVLAFAAARGISTLGALRRLVKEARRSGPADWERECP